MRYEEIQANSLTYIPQFGTRTTFQQLRIIYSRTLYHLRAPADVLDWGCGEGHFSLFLTRNGFSTTGFSFGDEPPHMKNNPLYHHRQASQSDPVGLPFANSTFDAVFSIGVLEHVHEIGGDEAASLREINRILKPGGLFLCFHFPNIGSWIERVARLSRVKFYYHPKRFSKADIARITADTGFEIIEQGRYAIVPRNIFGRSARLRWLADRKVFARAVDIIDDVGGRILPYLCQNHFFIVRKPSTTGTPV